MARGRKDFPKLSGTVCGGPDCPRLSKMKGKTLQVEGLTSTNRGHCGELLVTAASAAPPPLRGVLYKHGYNRTGRNHNNNGTVARKSRARELLASGG